MKKLFSLLVILLFCSGSFIPDHSTSSGMNDPKPKVDTKIVTIKGHEYLIVTATNCNSLMSSNSSPTIALQVLHAESCPCKNK